MSDTKLPWDDERADPLGDMRRLWDEARDRGQDFQGFVHHPDHGAILVEHLLAITGAESAADAAE